MPLTILSSPHRCRTALTAGVLLLCSNSPPVSWLMYFLQLPWGAHSIIRQLCQATWPVVHVSFLYSLLLAFFYWLSDSSSSVEILHSNSCLTSLNHHLYYYTHFIFLFFPSLSALPQPFRINGALPQKIFEFLGHLKFDVSYINILTKWTPHYTILMLLPVWIIPSPLIAAWETERFGATIHISAREESNQSWLRYAFWAKCTILDNESRHTGLHLPVLDSVSFVNPDHLFL